MEQAKVTTEQDLKRALAALACRKHADRDKLALLLSHCDFMRVCNVPTLTHNKELGPTGAVLEEYRANQGKPRPSDLCQKQAEERRDHISEGSTPHTKTSELTQTINTLLPVNTDIN